MLIMNAPKPKDVLPLAQEIQRLEAQLAEARRKWNLLFGIEQPEKRQRASRDGLSLKVLDALEKDSESEFTIAGAALRVSEPELQVGRALYRLARLGKIQNPSRGRYKANEKEASSEEKTS